MEQLSPSAATAKACAPWAHAPQEKPPSEKLTHHSRVAPALHSWRKPHTAMKTQHNQNFLKINTLKNNNNNNKRRNALSPSSWDQKLDIVCQQGSIPSRGSRRDSILYVSASGGSGYSLASGHITPISASVVTLLPSLLSLFFCISLVKKDTGHWI